MLGHNKAGDEQDRHQGEIAYGQVRKQVKHSMRIVSDSFRIFFLYVGQQRDITSVYLQKNALTGLARLQACDAGMDE